MKISIDDVALEQSRDRWRIALTVTADDGTTNKVLHLLPTDTMEWRAAEYGIDPADTGTLLDIVLCEPHLTNADWASGTKLHDAPDIDTARRDHLARCAAVKWRHRMSTRVAGSPVERVRTESLMDAEAIAVKTEHVARVREALLAEAARTRAQPVSRAELLRRRLLPTETPRTGPYPALAEEI